MAGCRCVVAVPGWHGRRHLGHRCHGLPGWRRWNQHGQGWRRQQHGQGWRRQGGRWRRQRQGRRLGCQAPSHAAAPATAELRQAEAINYSTKGGGRLKKNGDPLRQKVPRCSPPKSRDSLTSESSVRRPCRAPPPRPHPLLSSSGCASRLLVFPTVHRPPFPPLPRLSWHGHQLEERQALLSCRQC